MSKLFDLPGDEPLREHKRLGSPEERLIMETTIMHELRGQKLRAIESRRTAHPEAAKHAAASGLPEGAFQVVEVVAYFDNNIAYIFRAGGVIIDRGDALSYTPPEDEYYNHNAPNPNPNAHTHE